MSTNNKWNIHDGFYRRMMRDLRVAEDFFRQHLPSDIVNKFDFSTLKRDESTHIQPNLRERRRDLTYEIKCRGLATKVRFIIEHQSEHRRKMPYRLLQYLLMLLEDFFETYRSRRPPKLPMVFSFHFSNAKNSKRRDLGITSIIDGYKRWIERYFFKPIDIDLNYISDKELERQPWIGGVSLVMKRNKMEDALSWAKRNQSFLIKLIKKPEMQEYIERIMHYNTMARPVKNYDELERVYQTILQANKEKTMSGYLEYLKKRAKAEGKAEGKVEGRGEALSQVSHLLRDLGAPQNFIQEVSNLTAETN